MITLPFFLTEGGRTHWCCLRVVQYIRVLVHPSAHRTPHRQSTNSSISQKSEIIIAGDGLEISTGLLKGTSNDLFTPIFTWVSYQWSAGCFSQRHRPKWDLKIVSLSDTTHIRRIYLKNGAVVISGELIFKAVEFLRRDSGGCTGGEGQVRRNGPAGCSWIKGRATCC